METGDLEGYKSQLDAIDAQLAICTDLKTRNELFDMRKDLEELISLITEELKDDGDNSQPGTSTGVRERAEGILTEEELIGMQCRAPYFRQVDRAIQLHDAVIFDIVNKDADAENLKVLVLYCYPLEEKMRPCDYFLEDRCTYGKSCRFSHGEIVLFSELVEHAPPDFSEIKENKLILVQDERRLWSSARIVAIEGEEIAARLLSSGKEIACALGNVVPLNEEVTESDGDRDLEIRASDWPELKNDSLGQVKVGDIGDWQQHTRGIGMKLLLKMGYKLGEGLGRDSQGIVHAVQPVVYPKNKSLDFCMERKRKFADGIEEKKNRVKKELAKQIQRKTDTNVFDVINQSLAPAIPSEAKMKENERKQLKESSAKELGISALNMDREIKELKAQEKKLREGITRNLRDSATTANLKRRLSKCQEEIQKVIGKQERLSNEVSLRKKKKDFF